MILRTNAMRHQFMSTYWRWPMALLSTYPKLAPCLHTTPWILDSMCWISVFVSGNWILDSTRWWNSVFLKQYSGFQSPGFWYFTSKIFLESSFHQFRNSYSHYMRSLNGMRRRCCVRVWFSGYLVLIIQWCECYARCDWSLPMIY